MIRPVEPRILANRIASARCILNRHPKAADAWSRCVCIIMGSARPRAADAIEAVAIAIAADPNGPAYYLRLNQALDLLRHFLPSESWITLQAVHGTSPEAMVTQRQPPHLPMSRAV